MAQRVKDHSYMVSSRKLFDQKGCSLFSVFQSKLKVFDINISNVVTVSQPFMTNSSVYVMQNCAQNEMSLKLKHGGKEAARSLLDRKVVGSNPPWVEFQAIAIMFAYVVSSSISPTIVEQLCYGEIRVWFETPFIS